MIGTVGVLGKGAPYIWSLPEKEINEIQNNLPVKERFTAKEKVEQVDKSRGTLISFIGTVATIVGGIALIANVCLAVWKLKQDDDKNKFDKNLAESRLISERFSKSIEQLGSESIHICLGGIYSLEKIAKDSPEDHWTVMEVLSAFIREESSNKQYRKNLSTRVSTDVQVALSVIAHRDNSNDRKSINLSDTNLNSVDMMDINLSNAVLISTNLSGSALYEAELVGAHLIEAKLNGAYLIRANLHSALLIGADLRGANFWGANLSGADLRGANLEDADLEDANLSGANLSGANLKDARLGGADLSGADLSDVKNLTDDQLSAKPFREQTFHLPNEMLKNNRKRQPP
jgi:uncharacterized protein YjbI with pentapeptide repeats